MWFFEFPRKVDSCQYFLQGFKKYLNHKYLIVLGNIYMFKDFWGLSKKIVFGFMKNIGGFTKEVVWNSIVLLNDNFLEQEFENFNLDEVDK